MFNNHTISLITNLEDPNVIAAISNIDFVTVAAVTDQEIHLPNVYNASVLIPPTDLLMAWADGNIMAIQYNYPLYLQTKDPDDMITAIIAALTKKNIFIYIPMDEFEIFGMALLNHLYYFYGITCNTPTTMFQINQSKIPFIISRFYMLDLLDANTYISMYPGNQPLPDFVINKLIEDLHPFSHQATFMEYVQYFNNLNADKMRDKPLMELVKIVSKEQSK